LRVSGNGLLVVARQQACELVPSHAREPVGGRRLALQNGRQLHQHCVAAFVPKAVVDLLEVVEIENHHTLGFPGQMVAHALGQFVGKAFAIQQACEGVDARLALKRVRKLRTDRALCEQSEAARQQLRRLPGLGDFVPLVRKVAGCQSLLGGTGEDNRRPRVGFVLGVERIRVPEGVRRQDSQIRRCFP